MLCANSIGRWGPAVCQTPAAEKVSGAESNM